MTGEYPSPFGHRQPARSLRLLRREAARESENPEPSHALFTLVSIGVFILYAFFWMKRLDFKLKTHADFQSEQPLSYLQLAFFAVIFIVENVVLLMSASAVMQRFLRRWPKRIWLGSVLVVFAAFTLTSIRFRIFQTLRDGIDLATARSLGGGSLLGALSYIREEMLGMAPWLCIVLAIVAGGAWAMKKHGRRWASSFDSLYIVREGLRLGPLLGVNFVLLVLGAVIAITAPRLDDALSSYFSHQVYSIMAFQLGAGPGDNYDGMPSVLTAGSGLGADSPAPAWREPMGPWDGRRLQHKNVLVIVLESARLEIQDASMNGQPVMPVFRKLAGQPISFVSSAGMTAPAVRGIFTGALSTEERPGMSVLDRFHDLGYRTAIVSAQNESYGNNRLKCRMDHADLFMDATLFPQDKRMYSWTSAGELSMPSALVAARFGEWLEASDQAKPFFAYINVQEMHFPYYYPGLPLELTAHPVARREILPKSRAAVRETYFNSARAADHAIGEILARLDRMRLRDNTIVLVMGDHGEELYDHGYLGHGVDLCYEDRWTVGKLLNSRWKAPAAPVATADTSVVLYNALLRSPAQALPLDHEVLCYAGDPTKPLAIGLATPQGLIRYQCRKRFWTSQDHFGAPELAASPDDRLIRQWRSFVSQRLAR